MANPEHDSPTPEASPRPLVPAGASQQPGQELVSVTAPYASPGGISRSPEVVSGGVDPVSLWHAFRRRWLLATILGLFLASGAAVGLYYLFPVSNTAIARFLVKSETPSTLNEMETYNTDYDVFRATQMAMLRRPKVLNQAIQAPDVRGTSIPFLDQEEDKVAFLAENLLIRFDGDSELLQVALSLDEQGTQLKAVVDAVCDAYLEVVVARANLQRNMIKDTLDRTHLAIKREITGLLDQAADLRKDLNLTADGTYDSETKLIISDITLKYKEQGDLRKALMAAQQEYMLFQTMTNSDIIRNAKIDAQLAQDPNIAQIQQEIMAKEWEIRQAQGQSKRAASRLMTRLQDEMNLLNQQLQAAQAVARQQIVQSMAGKPDPEAAMMAMRYQAAVQLNSARLQQLDEEITELKDQLAAKSEKSTELLVLNAEIEQKQYLAADIAQRLENWQIEIDSNAQRIELLEQAVVIPGINRTQQYAIAGVGGVATLGLVCLGVAYLEFMNRKLNGPTQVDEGLGIRVVGVLPGLGGRKSLNPNHPVVAQLTESIDSVRTALMHEATNKPRKVVLVTSPATKEGRSTVATHLALSLARAGRRTLLIDADIRSPSLHRMFDESIEDGLCEVLRAEVDVADVLRATQADGLWLLTAGYCDADAVHAMATDQIQPIFDKLRADFDFIIIDGAPVLGLSDSLMIGQHCDGVLLSVLRDQTQVPKIYQSAELLRSVGIRMIGAVVNGVKSKVDRRVTHLRKATPKAERKQLESAKA